MEKNHKILLGLIVVSIIFGLLELVKGGFTFPVIVLALATFVALMKFF